MTQLIPFSPKAVSANRKPTGMAASILANVVVGGFPVISYKGKSWTTVRDGERSIVTRKEYTNGVVVDTGEPALSLEIVIESVNPNRSRVFYIASYEEGSNAKPDCYSNDGKAPASDAQSPQAKTCAACVHGRFGSKVSESGQKGFACSNSQRLAVAPVGNLTDPMLLRIPGASLKKFVDYVRDVAKAGYDLDEVVTKVGFDHTKAYPEFTFKAVGVLPEDMVAVVREISASELVGQITGLIETPQFDDHSADDAPAATAALPKREPKQAPAKKEAPEEKAEAEMEAVLARAAAKKKPEIKVEESEKPAPAKKAATATVEDMGDDLDSLLDGTDFDD